jgi:hypothetical protein
MIFTIFEKLFVVHTFGFMLYTSKNYSLILITFSNFFLRPKSMNLALKKLPVILKKIIQETALAEFFLLPMDAGPGEN